MSDFDFGFNAVSLDELNFFQEQKQTIETTTQEAEQSNAKLVELRAAIQPLLNNLKADPSKDYLLWPGRVPKIEEFEAHLDGIVNKS
jgi:hypothetical protein